MSASNPTFVVGALATAAAGVALVSLWRRLLRAEAKLASVDEAGVSLPEMPLLPISSPRTINLCRELKLLDSDLFICSYPKSGTTWMQNIVVTLLTRGKHPDSNEHISEFAPFFEIDKTWDQSSGSLVKSTKWPGGRRCFNTHLRWDQMPKHSSGVATTTTEGSGGGGGGGGAKYVYVVRDGKDVATSFYQHLSHQDGDGGFQGSFDDFFDPWLEGSLPYGRHVDHIKSWLLRLGQGASLDTPPAGGGGVGGGDGSGGAVGGEEGSTNSHSRRHRHHHHHHHEVLVVYYEDLLANLGGQVERVNDFLGLPTLSAAELEAFTALTSFASMKANINRFQPQSVTWKPGFSFIRNGRTGDHKAMLSPAQVQRYRETLKESFPLDILTFKAKYFE